MASTNTLKCSEWLTAPRSRVNAWLKGSFQARLEALPGAKPDARSADDAPLLLAASRGHRAVAELLLAAGADVEQRGVRRRTALMLAAAAGHADTVDLLLERGARAHVRDADGNTAETLALAAGHEALARRIESASRGPGLRDLF